MADWLGRLATELTLPCFLLFQENTYLGRSRTLWSPYTTYSCICFHIFVDSSRRSNQRCMENLVPIFLGASEKLEKTKFAHLGAQISKCFLGTVWDIAVGASFHHFGTMAGSILDLLFKFSDDFRHQFSIDFLGVSKVLNRGPQDPRHSDGGHESPPQAPRAYPHLYIYSHTDIEAI